MVKIQSMVKLSCFKSGSTVDCGDTVKGNSVSSEDVKVNDASVLDDDSREGD